MRRAAIYARFSSDLQRDRSIEDQVALCEGFAARNGFIVSHRFDDRARSGSSVIGRDGIMRLMEAARDRAFDVVVVEALDRLSRDQEDLAGIYKRLSFAGIDIQAVHDGLADQVQVGIRGLVGALYLQDLGHKVRRGMAGVVRDGRYAGGRAFGYAPVPGEPGVLRIVENEAAVVRGIFADYVAGQSPRQIAMTLNRRGIQPPRGEVWTAVAINGNKTRGHGIILNSLYAGQLTWNRVRMVKDPDTGKRISRANKPSEWQTSEAPHLRIIDDATWSAAQAIKQDKSVDRPETHRKPKHLLSGLLRCGACGGGMSIKDTDHGRRRVHCSRAKETGTCEHRRAFYLDTIETTVLSAMADQLANPQAIEIYLRAYNAERRQLAASTADERPTIEGRLAAISREHERVYQGYVKGFVPEADAERTMADLKAEREKLESDLERCAKPVENVVLHPTTVAAYLGAIDRLREAVSGHASDGDLRIKEAFREIVDTVTIMPEQADGQNAIQIMSRLTSMIGGAHFPSGSVLMSGGTDVARLRYHVFYPRPPACLAGPCLQIDERYSARTP